jgi:hypothetical protein
MFVYAFIPWCYTRFGAYPNYTRIQIFEKKNQLYMFFNKASAQIGTHVRALLARSQFASGRSYDGPTRSRFSMVFLGPRANAELVPKFQVPLHASHAALPMVTFPQ